MKNFYLIMTLLGLLSCNSEIKQTEHHEQEILLDDYGEQECIYKKDTTLKSNKFPFNISDKIKVISYKDYNVVAVTEKSSEIYVPDSVIENGKVVVPNIYETITLNSQQIDSLYSILFNYKTKREGNVTTAMSCYVPRHSIIFYKKNKPIAFIEICFECEKIKKSNVIPYYFDFCSDKWCMLQNYFKWIGITKELTHLKCK